MKKVYVLGREDGEQGNFRQEESAVMKSHSMEWHDVQGRLVGRTSASRDQLQ